MMKMVNCRICKTDGLDTDSFCKVCSYPLKGTEKEQAVFGARFIIQKGDIKDAVELLIKARVLLFVLGVFSLGSAIFLYQFSDYPNIINLLLNMFLAFFFLGCGILL